MTNEDGRIVVAGLTKTYGTLRAVDDLRFTVEPGTITGLQGRAVWLAVGVQELGQVLRVTQASAAEVDAGEAGRAGRWA
jgi:ABC-type uncharacterized transport system ATPase subunit